MVAFLALLAEATNAISAAVIVSCLLLVTVLIVRYQHGDEGGWGGSSVVRVQHRPVQVAVQKLFVPYTLTLVREEGVGSGSSTPSSGMTRVRLQCEAVGRGVLVRWWWGVRRDALLDLLHAPWWRHYATVRDSSALDGCSGGLELDEGSHSVLLELPEGRRLGLGPAPRAGYPLVVVQLDPTDQDDDQHRVSSVVSLFHVPDAVCPEPARMLYQYLKQRTGQFTLVTTLYTQANGVEPSTIRNATEQDTPVSVATDQNTSTPGPSAESSVTAPQETSSTSSDESEDLCEENRYKSLLQPPTVASDVVIGRSSSRELADGQNEAVTPSASSSSSKCLGINDSKDDYDVITGWEWQSEEDKKLEPELNDLDLNDFESTHSVVHDDRQVVEEVILDDDKTRYTVDTAKDTEARAVDPHSIDNKESGNNSQTVRSPLVADDDKRPSIDDIHNSSHVARVTCIQSTRLIDCPDALAKGFTNKSGKSNRQVNLSVATGTDTEHSSLNSGKTKDCQLLPSTHNLLFVPDKVSTSSASAAQSNDKVTVTEQLTEEEDASSVLVEERPFSSSDCVVCQECRTSLALLPCRHVCVCSSCFDQLMASPQQACPLCRQRVQAFFEV